MLERYHLDFVRAGARLEGAAREQFAHNAQHLAKLFTQFSQNVLADETSYCLVLYTEDELKGLPDLVRAASRQLAKDRGLTQDHAHSDHLVALITHAFHDLFRAARFTPQTLAGLVQQGREPRSASQPHAHA